MLPLEQTRNTKRDFSVRGILAAVEQAGEKCILYECPVMCRLEFGVVVNCPVSVCTRGEKHSLNCDRYHRLLHVPTPPAQICLSFRT